MKKRRMIIAVVTAAALLLAAPAGFAGSSAAGGIADGVRNTTIKASSALGDGCIKISWEKSPGYKVDYYEIFRSTVSGKYGSKPYFTTKDGNATYYKNTKGLKKGVRYYYKVRGVRKTGGKTCYTKWSNQAYRFYSPPRYYGFVEPGNGPSVTLPAPQVTAAAAGRSSIDLSWPAVKGADGYVIYRSTGVEFDGDFEKIKTIAKGGAVSYTDETCGTDTYCQYEIFAYKNKNGKRIYSQTARVEMTAGVMKPLASAYPGSLDSIHVSGGSMLADKLTFYRSAAADGEFEKIGEYDGAECFWIDENLSFGQTWYYKVEASRTIGSETYTSCSDVVWTEVRNPHLEISVADLTSAEGGKTDTFVYRLTSEVHNFPAVIYKEGKYEDREPIEYSYWSDKGGVRGSANVVLDSYSTDGVHFVKMEDTYVLEPGQSVYLKFKAKKKVTYYKECRISLDMSLGESTYRVKAGSLELKGDGTGTYSYDY